MFWNDPNDSDLSRHEHGVVRDFPFLPPSRSGCYPRFRVRCFLLASCFGASFLAYAVMKLSKTFSVASVAIEPSNLTAFCAWVSQFTSFHVDFEMAFR